LQTGKAIKKEEEKLWSEYEVGGDTTDLINYYTPLANKIARNLHKKLPHFVDVEDIKCSALQGLWSAILKYDDSKGVPFKVYCRRIIKGQIIDHLREFDHESRSMRKVQKVYRHAENNLQHELKRDPTDQELASSMEIPVKEVTEFKQRIQYSKTYNITKIYRSPHSSYSDDEMSFIDNLPDDVGTPIPMDEIAVMRIIMAPWTKLERLLFALVYFENLNLDIISDILGISHPNICQMHYRIGDQLSRVLTENCNEEI
jgi:RNA polymerase sigma factor FliA